MAADKDDGFEEYVQSILDEVAVSDRRVSSIEGNPQFLATRLVEVIGMESWVLHKQDIKVQVLIAEQLKRIADQLEAIQQIDVRLPVSVADDVTALHIAETIATRPEGPLE